MDLSKHFDTINHSLLLAKLEPCGFSMTFLKLMQSYLCNRFQSTSVNASFSYWKEIETGVPQGNLCKYTGDNALYPIRKSLNMVKENLKINFLIMQKLLYENHMVLNPGKCHYLGLGKRSRSDTINLNGTKLANTSYEKLLGILTVT